MRRFPSFVTAIVPLLFAVFRHTVVGASHSSVLPVYLTALLFSVAEVFYQSSSLLAAPLVHRNVVIAAIMAYTTCVALPVAYWNWHSPAFHLPWWFATTVGVLAGVIIRTLFVSSFRRTLEDARNASIEMLRLLSLGIYVYLFPEGISGVFYQIGLGLGLCLHAIVRGLERSSARWSRDRSFLVQLLDSAGKLTSDEITAARFFVEQKWKDLNRFLNERGHYLTTGLVIVRILQRRREGDYDGASRTADAELRNPSLNRDLEALLRLLLALSQWDAGAEVGTVLAELERVRRLQPHCVPANTTEAVLRAMTLPSSGYTVQQRDQADLALALVMEASRRLTTVSEWPWLVGRAVAVSVTYVQAALGLVLLKTGQPYIAKEVLISAIWSDPTYAPAYLYLALYYFNEFSKSTETERSRSTAWLTRLCLRICIGLERHPNAVRRTAEGLARQLRELEKSKIKATSTGAATVRP